MRDFRGFTKEEIKNIPLENFREMSQVEIDSLTLDEFVWNQQTDKYQFAAEARHKAEKAESFKQERKLAENFIKS